MVQTSVEMVNPAGTGRPALVISARLAPLPPSRSRIERSPSALPSPKKYTCFFAREPRGRAAVDLGAARRGAAFAPRLATRAIVFTARASAAAGRRVVFFAIEFDLLSL